MDTPSTSTEPATPAPAPFGNYGSADIILRSSDRFDFYVHKIVLSLASPFFNQVFSLPQPRSSSSLPIIPVSEDRDTIDYLLRLCYPIVDPIPPTDVAATAKILEAAIKYDLEEACVILKKSLVHFVPTQALKVYAHACRLRLEDEASKAAIYWREKTKYMFPANETCRSSNHPVDAQCADPNCVVRKFEDTGPGSLWVGDMKDISAGCLYRFLRFIRTGILTSFCDPPLSSSSTPDPPVASSVSTLDVSPGILTLCPPDIIIKSSDSKLAHTYKTLLVFAGATGILEIAHRSTPPVGGLPVVYVDADQKTILNLLRICQPFDIDMTRRTFTTKELHKLWDVAHKYGMTQAKEVIRLSWRHHIQDAPLPVYFTAKKNGWTAEAEMAAERSSSMDEGGYAPEMEFVSADTLHEFYRDQHTRHKVRLNKVQKVCSRSVQVVSPRIPRSSLPTTRKPPGKQPNRLRVLCPV